MISCIQSDDTVRLISATRTAFEQFTFCCERLWLLCTNPHSPVCVLRGQKSVKFAVGRCDQCTLQSSLNVRIRNSGPRSPDRDFHLQRKITLSGLVPMYYRPQERLFERRGHGPIRNIIAATPIHIRTAQLIRCQQKRRKRLIC